MPPESSLEMLREAAALGVECRRYLVPQAGHIQAYFDREAVMRAIKFLDEVLADSEPE